MLAHFFLVIVVPAKQISFRQSAENLTYFGPAKQAARGANASTLFSFSFEALPPGVGLDVQSRCWAPSKIQQ